MNNFQKFLHFVYTEVGYVGKLDFSFAGGVTVTCTIAPLLNDCSISCYDDTDIVFGDDVIDKLDAIDRERTFGLPMGVMLAARKAKEELIAELRAATLEFKRKEIAEVCLN